MAGLRYTKLSFAELKGWADDDHQAALDVYKRSHAALPADWPSIPLSDARAHFETLFAPVMITDDAPMLFTGYYEPEFAASPLQTDTHKYPALAVPSDLSPGAPYLTRREIEEGGKLTGLGLDLAWFSDPVDLFFLQVQGSGRVRFPDGRIFRLGFGAKNGHPYTSIGKVLVSEGAVRADQISPDAIRAWVAKHGPEILCENDSYVFFRRLDDVPMADGPLGALGVSVTAGRTLAVDPEVTPLGALVWIEKAGADPLNRLMVAQDTGSAIKGPQRADIFCGTGRDAGERAGTINDGGRMIVLFPLALADRLCEGGPNA